MRLLIVSSYFDGHHGGIEIVAGRLAREFQRAGAAVAWLASETGHACSEADENVRRVPVSAFNRLESAFGIPYPIAMPTALASLRREVALADVVMLHECPVPANIAGFLFARWLRKPIVIVQHVGIVPYRNPVLRGMMKLLTRIATMPMLAAADQVVFISNITAKAFAGVRYRRPPRLIFNGVDIDLFHPARDGDERAGVRRQLGLPLDRPVALFVGRFVEKKGLHILREAARRAADVVWVFAGWGPIDPRGWDLPNVCVYSGLPGKQLAALYRASDAFVLPSIGEGFPAVVQEALACGLPVVCGAETAQADERLVGLVHPIAIENRDPGEAAAEVVEATRAAIAEPRRDRLADVAGWYSWSRSGRQHLDIVRTLGQSAAGQPADAAALRPAGTDR
jgi:glycosyltransferase involved in cell wall biosynthesis